MNTLEVLTLVLVIFAALSYQAINMLLIIRLFGFQIHMNTAIYNCGVDVFNLFRFYPYRKRCNLISCLVIILQKILGKDAPVKTSVILSWYGRYKIYPGTCPLKLSAYSLFCMERYNLDFIVPGTKCTCIYFEFLTYLINYITKSS